MTIIAYPKDLIINSRTEKCVEWIKTNKNYLNEEILLDLAEIAAEYGDRTVINTLYDCCEYGFTITYSVVDGAAKGGQIAILDEFALKYKDPSLISIIVESRNTKVIDHLITKGNHRLIAKMAIRHKNKELLDKMIRLNAISSEDIALYTKEFSHY